MLVTETQKQFLKFQIVQIVSEVTSQNYAAFMCLGEMALETFKLTPLLQLDYSKFHFFKEIKFYLKISF